jgi:dipeptidyl aminopeptidase/acylaminoacyl peptidase
VVQEETLMKTFLLPLLFCECVLSACAVAPRHPALQGDALPELLPAREFFANRNSNGIYTVSPDGKKIAWIAVQGLGPALFVKTVGQDDIKAFKAIPIAFRWAQDSRRLFYLKDEGGNENYHVLMVDSGRPDAGPVDLTPYPGIQATIHDVIKSDPAHILVVHNHRDKTLFDLYKINIDTGAQALVAQNPGDAIGVVTGDDGDLVGVVRQSGNRMRLMAKLPGADTVREIISWDSEESVRLIDVAADRRSLYLLSNRNRDRIALTRLDLASGRETLFYEDPEVDIERALVSRISHEPLLAYAVPGYPKIHFFDAKFRADLERFLPDRPRSIHLVSTDDSEQKVTVKLDTDRETKYFFVDRGSGQTTLLGEGPNSRRAALIAGTKPITLHSRDGLPLHGYLTTPKGTLTGPLPMVLMVHGGPWWRDFWDNSLGLVQFLANRGYAVLQINYRGSTGYGRAFTEAAVGEFAGKMHDDLIDGVNWAIDQGIADRGKIAIMGASYGGYATLVGLSFTPETFACGVDIVGPSNLATLLETFPQYWKPFMVMWHKHVGDPANPEQRARMLAKSPVTRADAVQSPVLIIHAANDARVNQAQADEMVAALRRAGKPVDYLLFPDAGHSGAAWTWGKRLRAYRMTEDFLAKCLGGRGSGFDYYELAAWLF